MKKSLRHRTNVPGKKSPKPVLLVAIGASAGGLDAVSDLLRHIPSKSCMAFFYVQHLSPDHPSQLKMLLSKSTALEVIEAENGLSISPDKVYVCVPNREISIIAGKIRLSERPKHKLPYLPIDDFFRSMATAFGEKVAGVILSGNAADGTIGLKAIKEHGGVTLVQDKSAKYGSMAKSAIDSGVADFVLSPEGIAFRLISLAQERNNGTGPIQQKAKALKPGEDVQIRNILDILHKKTGVDFNHYKMTTVRRRLQYRLLHGGWKSLSQYARSLGKSESEATLLHKDLLINVTRFFREKEAFRYLKKTILPNLLEARKSSGTLRIWVPGCSTGEEAYSIAMIVTEMKDDLGIKVAVQIFATDLSASAVQEARVGEYTQTDVEQVSATRLKRFFAKSGSHYRIVKALRDQCIFATHNLLKDPPFSRIDLISCCNLLIYFDQSGQKKALTTFSFALNDGGYLMLGRSETAAAASKLYSAVSTRHKIFTKKYHGIRHSLSELLPVFTKSERPAPKKTGRTGETAGGQGLDEAVDAVIMSEYVPACAVINSDMEILKFRGSTAQFLSHGSGNATLNILKMTRPEFTLELRAAISTALKKGKPVKCEGIDLKLDSAYRNMTLTVHPLKGSWSQPLLLVVFNLLPQAANAAQNGAGKISSKTGSRDLRALTEKLHRTRDEMRSMIETHETSYEALQVANEEIVSTNEEFQTLNEELETSKEEIEATNEELISTNQELMMRNELLTESYKYSEAIIATIHEPMVVLDSHLCVKSANESFYKKFSLDSSDTVGISFFDLDHGQWAISRLRKALHAIISKNISIRNLEITHKFEGLGERVMQFNAHQVVQKTHKEKLILLAIEDVTERVRHLLREKANLNKNIDEHKAEKLKLEKAVNRRTKELQEKNVELESANKDLTSFTYVSSHDLQEPLRKMRNFVAVLLDEEKTRLSEEGRRYLERTYETAKRMQALIEDLLTYSRAKNSERRFQLTSLSKIVLEVSKDLEELIKDKHAVIKTGPLAEVPVIPSQFVQLFLNLISNSIKYAKPDQPPEIFITAKFIKAGQVEGLAQDGEGEYCWISFTDNGIGFDQQYADRIFEVFQRLHTGEKYAGTGMGLAICKRIVENHNGMIRAVAAEGEGARFDIYIPASRTLTE